MNSAKTAARKSLALLYENTVDLASVFSHAASFCKRLDRLREAAQTRLCGNKVWWEYTVYRESQPDITEEPVEPMNRRETVWCRTVSGWTYLEQKCHATLNLVD